MSKIAVVLSHYAAGGRPFNFTNLWDDPRALTGTDLTFVMIGKELQALGHNVSLFTIHNGNPPKFWEGCELFDQTNIAQQIDDCYDAVISLNDPDVFRSLPKKPKKILWQMVNDFDFAKPGFDEFVDLYLGVCDKHTNHLKNQTDSPHKWQTLGLGCNPEWYDHGKKVKGRMVFCSSPDRGLHWALSVFPKIKEAYPEAHLKVFYHFNETGITKIEPTDQNQHPVMKEMANRLRYSKEAMTKMAHLGVEHVGSVSVNQMKKEMSEAEVLLYPVDTVSFSEGFSISIMSAHASGAIPVISSADCIGDIYRDSGSVMTEAPVRDRLEEYMQSAIRSLKDDAFAKERRDLCLEFSKKHSWSDIAKKMEKLIGVEPCQQNEVKLNIGCAGNIFAYDGWINYDHTSIDRIVPYTKWIADEFIRAKSTGTPVNSEQMNSYNSLIVNYQKLANYIATGKSLEFRTGNMTENFPQHPDNSVDIIYVGQAIEHIGFIEAAPAFVRECYRMLKPGGVLRMTTPDLDILLKAYSDGRMVDFISDQPPCYAEADDASRLAMLMFGTASASCTQTNYEGHMFIYNQKSMNKLLQGTGFKKIEYHYESGKSANKTISTEVYDFGMSHSFAVDATK